MESWDRQHNPELAALAQVWENAASNFHDTTRRTSEIISDTCGPLVGVFGTARNRDRVPQVFEKYEDGIVQLGTLLAYNGFGLVSGGCPGAPQAMETAFKRSRLLPKCQPVLGIRIVLQAADGSTAEPDSPVPDVMFRTRSFSARVALMEMLTNGGVFFPGGWGTFLELAKLGQLEQLSEYCNSHGGPLIFFGTDFWQPFMELIKHMQSWGTLNKGEIRMLVTDDPEKALEMLLSHNGNRERAQWVLNQVPQDRLVRAI